MATPAFLKERKYQNPTSHTDTVFAKAYNRPDGATLWDILQSTLHLGAFNTYMATFNDGHKDWLHFYPVEERLGKGAESEADSVMMVDVGGGYGHQAVNFKNSFPHLPGRFIVQDLP